MLNQIFNEDCLVGMKRIPAKSVDMILCDLPYGMGANQETWDKPLDLALLWEEYKRIITDTGIIVLTASQPFTSDLIISNRDWFRYEIIWKKPQGTGFLNAKKMPSRAHENILVFYDDKINHNGYSWEFGPILNYMWEERNKSGLSLKEINKLINKSVEANHYFTNGVQFHFPKEEAYIKLQSTGFWQKPYNELRAEYLELKKINEQKERPKRIYNPQMTKGKPYKMERETDSKKYNGQFGNRGDKKIITENNGERYPISVIEFKQEKGLHPTQKPVALFEWLIKTYTNEGMTVLDNCIGSGTTAIACLNTGRNFIGFEMSPDFYQTAIDRIQDWRDNNES